MKRPALYLLVSAAAFVLGIAAASTLILSELPNPDEIDVLNERSVSLDELELPPTRPVHGSVLTIPYDVNQDGIVNFRNASLRYDPKVFSQARIEEIVEDSPLESDSDKPGEEFPRHTVFYLKWGEREASIRILPIAEYRRMYSVSESCTKVFDEQLEGVRKMSMGVSRVGDDEMPFIPFYDASQAFRNKVKPHSFRNGNGFFFLTEWDFEPTIINNERLTYFYQGISSDGKYYVLGEFPVSASFLPDKRDLESFEGYVIPRDYYLPEKVDSNAEKYAAYVSRISKRLEKLPDNRFQPGLGKIREVISSLEIKD